MFNASKKKRSCTGFVQETKYAVSHAVLCLYDPCCIMLHSAMYHSSEAIINQAMPCDDMADFQNKEL